MGLDQTARGGVSSRPRRAALLNGFFHLHRNFVAVW